MTTNVFNEKLNEIFTHLHNHPELSFEEHGTTKYIKEIAKNYQCKITSFDDIPGLVVEIGSGKPVVGIRADMDALWQEVDGEFKANHSCGHDAHMTIVIGTMIHLLENDLPKQGTVRFIFQPAEETGEGALALVERGVADDLDYFYGMHLRPIEELPYGQFAPALQHGSARTVRGIIKGEDAHGARPHLNANAILVGTEFFQKINNMYINPLLPHSVKMTAFQAGGKSTNIIPGKASFALDMRAQTNEAMEQLVEKVEAIAKSLADYHQVEIDLDFSAHLPAAVINEEATAHLKKAIIETVGETNLADMVVTTGGDDFHFFTIKRPEIKATMLAIGCDLSPGLHHAQMTFNRDILPQAVNIMVNALTRTTALVD